MTTEQSSPDSVPICLAAMGCLCAGHARGNDASAACDTSEVATADDDDGSVWCEGCESVALNMVCEDCASNATAERAREYATRRKALGLMSIDAYDAIMLMADDLEVIHG